MSDPRAIGESQALASFAAGLKFEEIPDAVVHRAEDLFVDWLGSVLGGASGRPIKIIQAFAESMGPAEGASEILISRRASSPYFAAMVNAAASHIIEQDDVHNGAVFHPGTVVFPSVLAAAQALGSSGRELITAAVAGYEVGIRVGEFLGRSHYRTFHTTGTAGAVAAGAAVARLLRLTPEKTLDAFGSAGTHPAGLWQFLRDAADSKPLHTARAAANGLMAAYLAQDGFSGARVILEGAQGLGVAMSTDADPARLVDGLGTRWALAETSFKFHASCRHTHPAADALLKVMREHDLDAGSIAKITAHVHQGAIDVLGAVEQPQTVHQAKFSMGTTLGLIATFGQAGVHEFDEHFLDAKVAAIRNRVVMELDPEVDRHYPIRWIGKVTVETIDGRCLRGRVDEPKGDPGNSLTRDEITRKVTELAAFGRACTVSEAAAIVDCAWQLRSWELVGQLMTPIGRPGRSKVSTA